MFEFSPFFASVCHFLLQDVSLYTLRSEKCYPAFFEKYGLFNEFPKRGFLLLNCV